jgi:hypothetical protein
MLDDRGLADIAKQGTALNSTQLLCRDSTLGIKIVIWFESKGDFYIFAGDLSLRFRWIPRVRVGELIDIMMGTGRKKKKSEAGPSLA